jgi:hypothetical protein
MTENGPASGHRHTVIIAVRVPDYPEPVRVVGVLLHENGVPFAVIDRIETGAAAILPDKIQLDPSLLRLRHNPELALTTSMAARSLHDRGSISAPACPAFHAVLTRLTFGTRRPLISWDCFFVQYVTLCWTPVAKHSSVPRCLALSRKKREDAEEHLCSFVEDAEFKIIKIPSQRGVCWSNDGLPIPHWLLVVEFFNKRWIV